MKKTAGQINIWSVFYCVPGWVTGSILVKDIGASLTRDLRSIVIYKWLVVRGRPTTEEIRMDARKQMSR